MEKFLPYFTYFRYPGYGAHDAIYAAKVSLKLIGSYFESKLHV